MHAVDREEISVLHMFWCETIAVGLKPGEQPDLRYMTKEIFLRSTQLPDVMLLDSLWRILDADGDVRLFCVRARLLMFFVSAGQGDLSALGVGAELVDAWVPGGARRRLKLLLYSSCLSLTLCQRSSV
jgi:hypothetical protein